jgi:hypothetical protein
VLWLRAYAKAKNGYGCSDLQRVDQLDELGCSFTLGAGVDHSICGGLRAFLVSFKFLSVRCREPNRSAPGCLCCLDAFDRAARQRDLTVFLVRARSDAALLHRRLVYAVQRPAARTWFASSTPAE